MEKNVNNEMINKYFKEIHPDFEQAKGIEKEKAIRDKKIMEKNEPLISMSENYSKHNGVSLKEAVDLSLRIAKQTMYFDMIQSGEDNTQKDVFTEEEQKEYMKRQENIKKTLKYIMDNLDDFETEYVSISKEKGEETAEQQLSNLVESVKNLKEKEKASNKKVEAPDAGDR